MSATTPYPPGFSHILSPKKWCDKKQVPCEYANIHGKCICTCCQRRDLEMKGKSDELTSY